MLNGMKPLSRSLRWGMVGGGGTSQIGYSHRCAALRDNVFTLLVSALDIDAERGSVNLASSSESPPSAATPTIKRYLQRKPNALTALKPFRSLRRTIPISRSPKQRWKRGCTLSAKNRCALPPPRPASCWR